MIERMKGEEKVTEIEKGSEREGKRERERKK